MKMPGKLSTIRAKRTQNMRGEWHDSAEEAAWFDGLIRLERTGVIRDLVRSPSYRIDGPTSGKWICNVKADASYFDTRDSARHVVDWKGGVGDTPVSRLKRRLVAEFHGVEIELVGRYVEQQKRRRAKAKADRKWEKRASKPRALTKR